MKDLENAIEQLKKHTGNDPIFDYYRGFIQFDAQNFEIALSYFDSTIQNADKFFDAYYLKLFSHLNLNDKEKALVTVRKLKEQFSIDEDYLNQHLIDFEAFIQSEEYKAIFNDAI